MDEILWEIGKKLERELRTEERLFAECCVYTQELFAHGLMTFDEAAEAFNKFDRKR